LENLHASLAVVPKSELPEIQTASSWVDKKDPGCSHITRCLMGVGVVIIKK